jgi:hypothetical protein
VENKVLLLQIKAQCKTFKLRYLLVRLAKMYEDQYPQNKPYVLQRSPTKCLEAPYFDLDERHVNGDDD